MPRTRAAATKAQQQLERDTRSQSERSPTPSSDDQSDQGSPELEKLFTNLAQAIDDSEAVVRARWDEAQTAFGAHISKGNRARRHRNPFAVSARPSEAKADGNDNTTRQIKAKSTNASSSRQQKAYTQASDSQAGGGSQMPEDIGELQGPPDGSVLAKISGQQDIPENSRVASADLDSEDESDTGAGPNQEEAEDAPGNLVTATRPVILDNQRAGIDADDGRGEEDSEDDGYHQNPYFGSYDNDDTFGTDIRSQLATSTPQHKTRQGFLDAESNYSEPGETAPGGEVWDDAIQHSDTESAEEEFFDSVFSHEPESSTLLDTGITLPQVISIRHDTQGNKSPSAKETFGRSEEQQPAMPSIVEDMRKDLADAVIGAGNDSEYRRRAREQQQEANKEIELLRKKHHARIDLILSVSHDDLLGDKATRAAACTDATKNKGPSAEEIETGIAEANRKRKVADLCIRSESAKWQKVAEKAEIARQAIRALAEAAMEELPPLYDDKARDYGDTDHDISYGEKEMVEQWT
ncbi:hypothetical protein CCHR01_16233 [Colletotrichum chrysophilum]|uniref:Uncharacterized protein n=1 Tax=Colletotrichum chrysophilum TaxID=1836956 RepID=A0AAD9A443_9PEZI|nr:hypothetical protein CCHR01_16233 [Colletotrichum chrysophilum]